MAYARPEAAAERLIEIWDNMEQDTRVLRPTWQDVADLMFPVRARINVQRNPGQLSTRMVDSTAMHAANLLSASMQGAVSSPAFLWFGLRIRGVEPNRDSQLQKDLDWCAQDMYDAMEESNYQSESHELYSDLPRFGTGAMYVEERDASLTTPPGALRFVALGIGNYNIDENEEGRVDTLFRKFKLSARAAKTTFGEEKLGAQIAAALPKRSMERFEFMQAVYPRRDFQLGRRKGRAPRTEKPWASITIDVAGKCIVDEGGFDRFPFMVPRWEKCADEVWGTGPGIVALPDVRTLNKAVELKLKAWAKVVDPPLKLRHQGVINKPQFHNGGLTYVRDMDAIQPLTELGGRLDIADMQEEQKREQIRRIFYSDQLQLQQGPQMTAYEVQVRYELMQRILGPTIGRVTVEYLNPLIETVFWIRLEASEPDSAYRRIMTWCEQNGKTLDIEYESPLAKSQRMQDSVSIQRALQLLLPLQQVDPAVMDNVDTDFAATKIIDSSGSPAGLKRDPKKRDEIRAARTQAQEQKSAIEDAQGLAKAGSDMAPILQAMAQSNAGQPGSYVPQPAPVLAGATPVA